MVVVVKINVVSFLTPTSKILQYFFFASTLFTEQRTQQALVRHLFLILYSTALHFYKYLGCFKRSQETLH